MWAAVCIDFEIERKIETGIWASYTFSLTSHEHEPSDIHMYNLGKGEDSDETENNEKNSEIFENTLESLEKLQILSEQIR